MDEKRTYKSTLEELIDGEGGIITRIAVVERLEAIVEELAEISKGLRFMALAHGVEKIAQKPEILKELFAGLGIEPPPSDSPSSKR